VVDANMYHTAQSHVNLRLGVKDTCSSVAVQNITC
jgi:hypothetical protein